MELFRPAAIRLKLFQRPYLKQIEDWKNVWAVKIEWPEIATIAANLVSQILLKPDYNLHFIFDGPSFHLSHAKHTNAWIIAHFHKPVLMAAPFWSQSINDWHLMTLHELVEHLLESKGTICLKYVFHKWVVQNLLCIALAKYDCLFYDLLLNIHD